MQKSILAFINSRKAEESSPGKADSGQTVQESKNPSTSASPRKPKRMKNWQDRWLSEFSWLRFDHEEHKMYCTLCERASGARKSLRSNAFVAGTQNFQHSSLTRHQLSDDHILAKGTSQQQVYMETAKKCVSGKLIPVVAAQIKTAMYIAEQNLPNRKFLSLIDLQLENGANVFKTGVYTNHQAASTFQKYVANVLNDTIVIRMKNSPFVGIMLDESLDIAVNKKLVLFCKILHNGQLKTEFCANVVINDGKAETVYNCIVQFLNETGIDFCRVSGLGSDGASVMMGKVSGVGVRMKTQNPRIIHVWCAAHRVALVAYWASKSIPYLKEVNETLVNVYTFYQYSAPRYQKLRELQRVLGKKVKRFKKPTQVRWLSLSDSITAFHDAYSALVLGLEHEQASNPRSEGAAKAKGILKKIKNFKFVITLCFLKDILAILDRISKLFQKDNIDVAVLKSSIIATKNSIQIYSDEDPVTAAAAIEEIEENSQYQGIPITVNLLQRRHYVHIKQKFVQNLVREFDIRFPPDDVSVLNDLNVLLNPKLLPSTAQGMVEYGAQSLERCIEFFGTQNAHMQPLVQAAELRQSHLQFKYLMNTNREVSLQDFCLMVINNYKEAFPSFCVLAEILCTIPMTSVPCERGFSLQNRHHRSATCRSSVETIQNRMAIEHYSSSVDKQDVIRKAAQNFCDNNTW